MHEQNQPSGLSPIRAFQFALEEPSHQMLPSVSGFPHSEFQRLPMRRRDLPDD